MLYIMVNVMSELNADGVTSTNTNPSYSGSIQQNVNNLEQPVESNNPNSITSKIGKGEDAKNSIIWTIITWSLAIPTAITFFYFITMWAVYSNEFNIPEEAALIRMEILKVWGIFIPIITLALGYLYGKSSANDDKSP